MTYYKPHSGGVSGYFRRNATTISMAVIALSVIVILFLQAITISKLSNEVASQGKIIKTTEEITKQIADNAKDRGTAIDGINRHMDCIVQFFSQPDRSQKSIDDIESCRIQSTPARAENTQPTNTQTPVPRTNSTTAPEPVQPPTQAKPSKPEQQGLLPAIGKTLTDLLGGIL